jgi:RNA recognition motif-containing protein
MPKSVAVFVENLPLTFKPGDLRQLFEPFGKLSTVFLATRLSGKSLGFGYVTYSSHTDAKQAVQALNGIELNHGRPLQVYLQDPVPAITADGAPAASQLD